MDKYVAFGGSRGLPSLGAPDGLVASVVSASVAAGYGVAVGCCVGADAAVASAALSLVESGALPVSRLRFFGIGFAGAGAPAAGWHKGSAVAMASACSVAGACCVWWAGGEEGVALPIRLRSRTVAVVSAAAVSGGPFVAFFGRGRSRGTLGACRRAVGLGVPVFAFAVGSFALPSLGRGGWRVVGGSSALAGASRWFAA